MKKRTWANPEKEWSGFDLVAYGLDWDKVTALSVTQQHLVSGKQEEAVTTLGDVFRKLANQQFEIESSSMGITVKMGTEELGYHKPIFAASLLAELIKFGKEDISPFDSVWFWYDNNSCRDDPHELNSFFVVYCDRIVRESVSFSDYHGSGFDPDVFQSTKETRPGADTTALFQNVPILLNKIRILLWVLIFLGAVVVLLLWK